MSSDRLGSATLRDVAERAGVSTATASRVITGSARVRHETRERVERAMRELLYVPPGAVRTGAIGLLVPELANPIFPALAQAMETQATKAGFATILCNIRGSTVAEAEYVQMLLERRVDGMIFISSEAADLRADHSHYARLLGQGARIVFVNGAVETLEVPHIGVDERAAGQIATQHLLDLGHTRIGFVAGPDRFRPTREKARGREVALEAAGISPNGLVAHAEFGVDGGRAAMESLLDEADPPTGVICSSDLMAIGALREATARGLRVPDDVSIVGFDGIEAAGWTDPPLTTIEQPILDIARTAVTTLRTLIGGQGGATPDVQYRPRLRVGGSTAPARSPRRPG
ncbi:MAG: LacI family DNA-binding transcriptional regulator [Verrucomicrobiota bacterium]